ncbi:phosphotransferase family protein [Pseudogracilibacillus auburnensis]|uniref:phosphotransferase family protein n=1 Tax=Pseudogracilibacillus auburnensis TaxID=1494959 RepID=UPI001A958603|nr:aminoglycoside phosphotransferase family protein [Pseudogracilibacillus auburnensis]MBO1005083.1 aminoglycoside phosphotransferase family protein [Pseudogracilibacillus auburnensis]
MTPIKEQEIPEQLLNVTGSIKQIRFPEQGCTSNVAIVESTNGLFVVKRSFETRYNQWLEREAFVLKNLQTTRLPIPKLYSFVKMPKENEAWILMEYIQGETLGNVLQHEQNVAKKQDLIFKFGKMLAMIHQTDCPLPLKTHGKLWLNEILETAAYDLLHHEVDGTRELLDRLMVNKPNPVQQTLIHGDYTVDNVLVNEGKIVAVIDWSGGAYGDPRYDLSLAIWPKEKDFPEEQFFNGYGEKSMDEEKYEYFANGVYEFL